jgi:hypothetical protein
MATKKMSAKRKKKKDKKGIVVGALGMTGPSIHQKPRDPGGPIERV